MADVVQKIISSKSVHNGAAVLQPTINGVHAEYNNHIYGSGNISLTAVETKYTNRFDNYQDGRSVAPSLDNGKTTINTTGTMIDTSDFKLTQGLQLLAGSGNQGTIYIGNSGVNSSNGFPLVANASVLLPIDSSSKPWASGSINGQLLYFIGL